MAIDHERLRERRDRAWQRDIKLARMKAHSVFDQLWKDGHMSRGRAYKWLAKKFDRDEVHMVWMSVAECKQVVRWVEEYLASLVPRQGKAAERWQRINQK